MERKLPGHKDVRGAKAGGGCVARPAKGWSREEVAALASSGAGPGIEWCPAPGWPLPDVSRTAIRFS